MIGSAWAIKDQDDHYVLLVVGPAPTRGLDDCWRCLVLMDASGMEKVGDFINYPGERLKEDFDRVG